MHKRALKCTFHKLSPKHLHRYSGELAERHYVRTLDTLEQMKIMAQDMVGRTLKHEALNTDFESLREEQRAFSRIAKKMMGAEREVALSGQKPES